MQTTDFDDVVRLNEAIDEALGESLASYTAEKEKHERRFQTVMTTSPDHVFVLDCDGKCMYANQALSRVYRIEPDNIVEKPLLTSASLSHPTWSISCSVWSGRKKLFAVS